MSYDPKKRPVFLGTEQNRTNPNRLKSGVMSVANQTDEKIDQVTPPTNGQNILAILKVMAAVLAAIAGSLVAASASGTALPAWLVSVATAILAIATPLGIVSTGVKPKPQAPSADSLK